MSFVRPKPVSTTFYVTSYIVGSVIGGILMFLGIIGMFGGAAAVEQGNEGGEVFAGIGFLLMMAGSVLFLYSFIVTLVLYYKMWDAIQDGSARTSPGAAVGFLFIPFFNIYWIFQAVWGFSKDYNAYLQRHQIAAQPLPDSLFLIFCILSIVSGIPYIGALFGLASAIIFIIMIVKICAAINMLAILPEVSGFSIAAEQPRENWRGV